jgi:Domain of unknown function (DUF6089)
MRFLPLVRLYMLLASLPLAGSIFFPLAAKAQTTTEIGGGLGGLNYRGEISPNYRLLNNRPALTGFYRRDLSNAITARGNLTFGFLRAADADVKRRGKVLPVPALRRATLNGFLAELMGGFEYNFLDYYDQRRRTRWTPYFFMGGSVYYSRLTTALNEEVPNGIRPISKKRSGGRFAAAIPVAVGIKYALSYHWNLGMEVGARRTFGDKFDYLSNIDVPELAQTGDTDWYYYNGVSLSYTFYKIVCPDIYRSQPNLLR